MDKLLLRVVKGDREWINYRYMLLNGIVSEYTTAKFCLMGSVVDKLPLRVVKEDQECMNYRYVLFKGIRCA